MKPCCVGPLREAHHAHLVMERRGLSPARGTVGQTLSTHAGQPGHPVSHSPVSAAHLAQARSCFSEGEWLPAGCTGSSDGILRHRAPPHARAPVGSTQGIPPGPRRHWPPLVVRDGCSLLILHPRSELGEPHWAPVPHPHRGAPAPCLLLSVRGQKGTSCRSQVVGSTCPRLRGPGAHALLPLSGLWCSLFVFRGPDGGKGGRWGHPGSGGRKPACWAPGACQDLGLEQRLPRAQLVRFTWPTSASRLHPPMRGQEALLQASGVAPSLQSLPGRAGLGGLEAGRALGPHWAPELRAAAGEEKGQMLFPLCPQEPQRDAGAGGEGPVDSPKGTGVGAPFTPDALSALSDLGATRNAISPWMSGLTLIRGPLSFGSQANAET